MATEGGSATVNGRAHLGELRARHSAPWTHQRKPAHELSSQCSGHASSAISRCSKQGPRRGDTADAVPRPCLQSEHAMARERCWGWAGSRPLRTRLHHKGNCGSQKRLCSATRGQDTALLCQERATCPREKRRLHRTSKFGEHRDFRRSTNFRKSHFVGP